MPPDRDLDRELRDLGRHVEHPPVPDLAGSVRGRLEMEAGGPEPASRPRSQLWWIAAAALILLLAVPVVSLALREMGGAFSAGGGAAGDAAESGGREAADGGPTGLVEEEGPMPANEEKAQAACASVEPVLEAHPSRGRRGTSSRSGGGTLSPGPVPATTRLRKSRPRRFPTATSAWSSGRTAGRGSSAA